MNKRACQEALGATAETSSRAECVGKLAALPGCSWLRGARPLSGGAGGNGEPTRLARSQFMNCELKNPYRGRILLTGRQARESAAPGYRKKCYPRSFRTSSASFSKNDSLISSSFANPFTRALDGEA
jgi:hypothetical protein